MYDPLVSPARSIPGAALFGAAPGSLQMSDDGLTAAEILAAMPHDAAAFVIYALVAVCVYLVWWAHRHAGDGRGPAGKPDGAPGERPDPKEAGRPPRRAA